MGEKVGKEKSLKTLNRREFVKKSAIAAGTVLAASNSLPNLLSTANAASRDHILIGRPNPATGPLAGFGEGSPWADDIAIKEINKNGGIYIKKLGKKLPIKIKMIDTESNPSKAGEAAARLIVRDKVDLMLFYHTPDTVNPVSAICERYKVPAISLDSPLEPWLDGGPYKWAFHAFWSVEKDIVPVYTGIWDEIKTNKKVGVLMANDPDGVAWSKVFKEVGGKKGYQLFDLGRFPYGLQDFSPFINGWKKNNCEILLANTIPPDFITAWRQCKRLGFVPKVATVGKALLFPSVAKALGGDLANGISTEVWWSPHHPFASSLSGMTAKQMCDRWTEETGKEWLQPLGFKYAGYEIVADVLNRAASLDKDEIRQAIAATDIKTIVGPIKFNSENYARTPLVGGQWAKGSRFPWKVNITYNKPYPNIPLTGKTVQIS
jgi:branched-chain amino acid transport system substrate-binding protein